MNNQINTNRYGIRIANQAFETICNKSDIKSAIDSLLREAGECMNVDSIYVYEFLGESETVTNTFEWNRKETHLRSFQKFEYTLTKAFLESNKDKKIVSLFEINKPSCIDQQFMYYYTEGHEKQVFIASIKEEDEIKGFISFERFQKANLSELEGENISTTVNVISTYLHKLRVVESIKRKLDFIKNYDCLTKLPTIHKFKKDVKNLITRHPGTKYAIVYIDFKNFKYINESIGEEAADQILIDFGEHLREYYSILNCIGRVESDRFVALLPFTMDEELRHQVEKNNEQFRQQMKKKSVVNNVALCAGICPISFGDEISVAIDNANWARKSTGEGQPNLCKMFNQELKDKIHRQIEIEDCMEAALDNKEFVVYLQPKIDLSNQTISGAEALVRWQKSEKEVLSPDEFIPVFERNGFIIDLDYYIYEEVCKILSKWKEEGRRIIPISVNVSRIHLNDDQFISRLKNMIDTYEIPASWLELELTENIFLENKTSALSAMRKLREFGFYVSIDDFGAGYSSLNLLKDMDTDVLKLDKEFFRTGTMNREDKIIVSSIVSMAKQLNMKVLSEGIETKSQSEFLQSIDCDMAQGYLFSKPVPVTKFEELIKH